MVSYLKRIYIIPAAIGLAALLFIAGYYLYTQKFQVAGASTNSQAEVKKLVAEVGKIIDLPTGEDPTLATVTDISKLAGQPFFQKAKNGDKVLIYANAKK